MGKRKDNWVALAMIAGAVAVLIGGTIGFTLGSYIDFAKAVSWAEVMTALGTVGSAIGAVVIAVVGRRQQRSDEVAAASRYAKSNVDVLIAAHSKLEKIKEQAAGSNIWLHFSHDANPILTGLEDVSNTLKALDIERIGLAFPGVANLLSSAKIFLGHAVSSVDRLPGAAGTFAKQVKNAQDNLQASWNPILLSGVRQ